MKIHTLFMFGIALVSADACTSSTEPINVNCPSSLLPSIAVSVLDSVSGASIGNAVTATAIDGKYFDAVTTPDLPAFAPRPVGLVSNRAGTYDVYVSKAGYRPWAKYDVVVKAAACGVAQAKITAALTSTSQP